MLGSGKETGGWSRRDFLKSVGAVGASGIIPFPKDFSPGPPVPGFIPQIPPETTGTVATQKIEAREVSFNSSVLYYHEVTKSRITSDITSFLRNGYQPISIDDFVQTLDGDKEIPPKTFMVTFDDSRLSQFTEGLPAIDAIQRQIPGLIIPVTFFAIVGFANRDFDAGKYALSELPDDLPAFYDGGNKYMNKAQLIQVLQWGHSLQNHTIDHPYLTRISYDDMVNEIRWGESRVNEIYKAAGVKRTVRTMAYPYGSNSIRERDVVASLGYDAAFATTSGTRQNSTTERFKLPRVRET